MGHPHAVSPRAGAPPPDVGQDVSEARTSLRVRASRVPRRRDAARRQAPTAASEHLPR
ncbi:hypothetical protein BN2537_10755 [Streptomyces venezuelae]|nr:hypothetical protein BN2537_10755 [Streptomyces venezuelae]